MGKMRLNSSQLSSAWSSSTCCLVGCQIILKWSSFKVSIRDGEEFKTCESTKNAATLCSHPFSSENPFILTKLWGIAGEGLTRHFLVNYVCWISSKISFQLQLNYKRVYRRPLPPSQCYGTANLSMGVLWDTRSSRNGLNYRPQYVCNLRLGFSVVAMDLHRAVDGDGWWK